MARVPDPGSSVPPPPPEPLTERGADVPPTRTPRRIPIVVDWRGSLREFFIIVAGVLAALGAQALWEGHQERQLEHSYLDQLVEDARLNAVRLAEAMATDSTALVAGSRLINALENDEIGIAADSILRWFNRAGSGSDFQPVTGAHRALIETGDLRVVRDRETRTAVIAYATALDRGTARLEQLRAAVLDLVPDITQAVPFMRLIFAGGPDAARVDVAALQRNDSAAAALAALHALNQNRLAGLRRMHEETIQLIHVLDADADGRAGGDSVRASR